MTPSAPKLRGRGVRRRGFGPQNISPGTDQEWEQMLNDPKIHAALSDPSVQQALAQSLPQGGQMPQKFDVGGSVADPNTDFYINSLPSNVDPTIKAQIRKLLSGSGSSPSASSGNSSSASAGSSSGSNPILGSIQQAMGTSGQSNPNSLLPLIQGALGTNKGSTSNPGQQQQMAPPSWGNTLAPMALAGALGASSGRGNDLGSALVGMGTAGLLNYFIRHQAQKQQKQQQQQQAQPPSQPGPGHINKMTPDMATTGNWPTDEDEDGAGAGDTGIGNMNTSSIPEGAIPEGLQSMPQLAGDIPDIPAAGMDDMFAKGGKVSKKKFATGGLEEEAPPPVRKPRAVLVRKPLGEAKAPVISTTIVLAKKKPTQKKKGGALKAEALPPKRGPEPQGPPAPFRKGGHVQVPRGSGAAIRGKRFGGIY